ncbi:MAG: GTPase Era [Saccharofermentanales bacterium]|jgi:GTP-binding protein Era|nr:GTPase Era [Clostridiaceae bacterium]
MSEQTIHSGFVSLIGRPNVGKSTLLNKLVGVRLAITSPKPQTTRQVVRGIIDDENSQIIFLDTPGFHAPRTRLGEYMVQAATTALADGDIALLLVDAEKATGERAFPGIPSIEANILQKAGNMNKKVILVLNKVDRVVKEALLPLMALYASAFNFAAIVPISAKTGDGLDRLISEIRRLLPEGPRYYPVDSLTDQTERDLCAELIREQILLLTSEEIPYGAAVEIESFTALADDEPQSDDGVTERELVRISAVIYCNKDSHKGILIGNRGSMLKNIGSRARGQIEAMLGCPCYLELHVKVREDWRNRRGILRNLGYETGD